MKDKIAEGLASNIRKASKQAGAYPYLLSLVSMVLLCLLYLAFSFVLGSYTFYIYLIALVVLVGLGFAIMPFLYGVTLSVSEACRFRGKKRWSIKRLYGLYYHSNQGVYGLGSVFWKTLLAFFLGMFGSSVIVAIVIMNAYPDMYSCILEFTQSTNKTLAECLGNYTRLFECFMIIVLGVTVLASSITGGHELRRNEAAFYAASSLITDNQVNMQTRFLINFFKREVFPTVKKEHFKYNMVLFWPAYLLVFIVFAGIIVLGIFVPSFYSSYVPYVAMMAGAVVFTPFYYWQRLFDDLFYIAYQDKIMSRVSRGAREYIANGRRAMEKTLDKFKEEESTQDGDYTQKDEDDGAKKPHVNPDGTFDFTDDDKKDDDHKDGKDE